MSAGANSQPVILMLTQVYVPDPASVGQHMADVAVELVRRGHRVRVLTARRGYGDARVLYDRHEWRDGVEVIRLPCSSFGKRTMALRLLGGVLFLLQAAAYGLLTRRLGGILVSTSPPMCSWAALVVAGLRRVPITYWLMDLNPDQMIALGRIGARNPLARALQWLNRRAVRRAADVVVLDRFMADRVKPLTGTTTELTVLPPWPHEEHLEAVPRRDNPFIHEHGLTGRRVVMYSGNYSLAAPLTPLIEAALQLQDDPRLVFVFVGGGQGKGELDRSIRQFRPRNIVSLGYQPFEAIKYSLSAADVHVVTMGAAMVGINHPCKVYGAMCVARPVLFIGPAPSHVSELLEAYEFGWRVAHGDVRGLVALLRRIADLDPEVLDRLGRTARDAVRRQFAKGDLCGAFCDIVEHNLPRHVRSPREASLRPGAVRLGTGRHGEMPLPTVRPVNGAPPALATVRAENSDANTNPAGDADGVRRDVLEARDGW